LSPGFALEQMPLKTSTAVRARSCAGDEQEEVAIEATDIHQASAARRQVPDATSANELRKKEPLREGRGSVRRAFRGEDEAGL
jgi:hypothetical protein